MKAKTTARAPAQPTGAGIEASPTDQQHARKSASRNSKQKASNLVGSGTDLGRPAARKSGFANRPPRNPIGEPNPNIAVVRESTVREEFHLQSVERPVTEILGRDVPAHRDPQARPMRFDERTLRRIESPSVSTDSARSLVSDLTIPDDLLLSPPPSRSAAGAVTEPEKFRWETLDTPLTEIIGSVLYRFDEQSLSRMEYPDVSMYSTGSLMSDLTNPESTTSLMSDLTTPEDARRESLSRKLPATSDWANFERAFPQAEAPALIADTEPQVQELRFDEEGLRRLAALLDVNSDDSSVSMGSTGSLISELTTPSEIRDDSLAGDLPAASNWQNFERAFPDVPAAALPAQPEPQKSTESPMS